MVPGVCRLLLPLHLAAEVASQAAVVVMELLFQLVGMMHLLLLLVIRNAMYLKTTCLFLTKLDQKYNRARFSHIDIMHLHL